jgi:nucleoside-diphosphate-sugar epimerase
MRILITGSEQPLGRLVAEGLSGGHDLRLTGTDLREPEAVEPLVEGIEAVVHLIPHQRFETPDATAEKEALDLAARGTFVLLHAALKAGVRRVVMVSRLDVMAAYPDDHVVDETWKPMPDAAAASLAPFLAELTLREFVRAEDLVGVCLRFGDIGPAPDGTTPEDAVAAIEKALTMDLAGRKYRWWLYHICSTERYRLAAAANAPLSFVRTPRNVMRDPSA